MARRANPKLVARANAAQPMVAAMSLDERLTRAARCRGRLEAAGATIIERAVVDAAIPRRFAERELVSALMFIDALPTFAEAIRPCGVPAVSGSTLLEWLPFGVVLGWHAANSPIWVPTLVVVSGLAAGNALISRPSRRVAGVTGLVLEAIAREWPKDAVVVADLAPRSAQRLIAHPDVHAVVAHASTQTCRRHLAILGRAYQRGTPFRPYIPEASGNDAFIVLSGADLAQAATAAAIGAFANSGQLCMAAKRLIVENQVWEAFRPLLVRAVSRLIVGDPADTGTDVALLGPGGATEHARRARAEAIAAGGQIIVGAFEHEPTIIQLPIDRIADLELWTTEVFAPLRGLVVCRDAEHAIRLANDSRFGLGAAVFGGDPHIAAHLRSARVVVGEGPLYQDPNLVVGGVGDSGMFGARPKIEQLVWARRIHRGADPGGGVL